MIKEIWLVTKTVVATKDDICYINGQIRSVMKDDILEYYYEFTDEQEAKEFYEVVRDKYDFWNLKLEHIVELRIVLDSKGE